MRRQRGFTLIELLVVIAIIAILATLVITQLSKAQAKARYSTGLSTQTQMVKAVELFKKDPLSNGNAISPIAVPAYPGSGDYTVAVGDLGNTASTCTSPKVAGDFGVQIVTSTSPDAYIDATGCNLKLLFTGSEGHGAGASTYGVKVDTSPRGYLLQYSTLGGTAAQTFGDHVAGAASCYVVKLAQFIQNGSPYNPEFPPAVSYRNGVQQIGAWSGSSVTGIVDCTQAATGTSNEVD